MKSAQVITLRAGDYRLTLLPERGGSVLRFDWRGMPLLRPGAGTSILDVACFPLVPYCNRIARGRFLAGGRDVRLAPNLPRVDPRNPLHGYGWLSAWTVARQDRAQALLVHDHDGADWPWRYRAGQSFRLDRDGLEIELSLRNLSETPMPAGLGFHPYFPRDDRTVYRAAHHGEWHNDAECLPRRLDRRGAAIDWWGGRPVATRTVDTVYTGREGPIAIRWPRRGIEVSIRPDDRLVETAVFVPTGHDFFCVEPMTHETDALNRPTARMDWCEAGQELRVSMRLGARSITGMDDAMPS